MPDHGSPRFELSPRLRAVAAMVVRGQPMADIGCDHALLPAVLVRDGIVPSAIGIDRRSGPLEQARRTLAALGLGERIELRRGDGLTPLQPPELGTVDEPPRLATIVVAGMGARTAAKVLTGLRFCGRLVVQPNTDLPLLGELRRFLAASGWRFEDEELVRDRGHLYVVMAARQTGSPPAPVSYGEEDLALGPILRARRPPHPLFAPWLARQRQRIDRTLAGLEHARRGHGDLAAGRRLAQVLEAAARGEVKAPRRGAHIEQRSARRSGGP